MKTTPLFKNLLRLVPAAALVCAAAAAELTLVENGKPNAVLLVPGEPPPPPPPADPKAKQPPVEKSKWLRAAEAIQTYVEKMSGAKLPILREGDPDTPHGTRRTQRHPGPIRLQGCGGRPSRL